MRWSFLSTVALAVLGAVASPVQEESSMVVGVAEKVSCDGSHFIVTVQRTDDVKEDSGELIAARVSNIIFDFKVDLEAESFLVNGYPLKLIPQSIRKITLLAAVIPPNHPALPATPEIGSIKAPEVIDALNKLERTGLITADVDLFVTYEGDVRHILIHVRVTEVEGCMVTHRNVLAAQITILQHNGTKALPQHDNEQEGGEHHRQPHSPPHSQDCATSDFICRLSNWINSLTPSCGSGIRPDRNSGDRHPKFRGPHRHPGEYHRNRFNRPRHGFMKFVISVVVPVLIGAAAGVGIGILSVFIAEIVGGIIMRIRGRRNAEYIEVDVKDDQDGEDELPVYEELEENPAYTAEEKQ